MTASPSPTCRRQTTLLSAALAVCAAAWIFQWVRMELFSGAENGWLLIPLLSVYFICDRWRDRPRPQPARKVQMRILWASALVVLLLVPWVRLLLQPFPGWPLAEWTYALLLACLALALIAAHEGLHCARHLAWPIVPVFAALPWPAMIGTGLMGRLRVLMASGLAELVSLAGQPAIATGTVIQTGRGLVGIEEACGGTAGRR